jgi:hypothetical protein
VPLLLRVGDLLDFPNPVDTLGWKVTLEPGNIAAPFYSSRVSYFINRALGPGFDVVSDLAIVFYEVNDLSGLSMPGGPGVDYSFS